MRVDPSFRIHIHFLHASGNTYTWHYRLDALYAILNMGGWPEEVEQPLWVELPENIIWSCPEGERGEQARLVCSMLEQFMS